MSCTVCPYFLDEDISLGELCRGGEGVLYDPHHRAIGLGGKDVTRHHQYLLKLRLRLQALWHVQVHLISVEVSVVGCGDGEVESEGRPGKDLDPVPHHGHLVKCWLTVEHHQIIVYQVTLHLVSQLQVEVGGLGMKAQIHTLPGVTDDVLGAGILIMATANQLCHPNERISSFCQLHSPSSQTKI